MPTLFDIFIHVRSWWYFRVLGRKRDMVKGRDCRDFEDTGVDINKYIIRVKEGVFIDEQAYLNAVAKSGKKPSYTGQRSCCGDGHFMCYRCHYLDYKNSDLIPQTNKQ
jgi:hypothetical protein